MLLIEYRGRLTGSMGVSSTTTRETNLISHHCTIGRDQELLPYFRQLESRYPYPMRFIQVWPTSNPAQCVRRAGRGNGALTSRVECRRALETPTRTVLNCRRDDCCLRFGEKIILVLAQAPQHLDKRKGSGWKQVHSSTKNFCHLKVSWFIMSTALPKRTLILDTLVSWNTVLGASIAGKQKGATSQ